MRTLLSFLALLAVGAEARELSWVYVVPAAANAAGRNGTDWHTDLTLVNPQDYALPVVLQFLPTGRDNRRGVPTVTFDLYPFETLNLWDVLGPKGFNARGAVGALVVAADTDRISCPANSSRCHFAVFSRTYTVGPLPGEFGQALPGFPAPWGLDWSVRAWLPQVSNDQDFRTNLGVASLSAAFVEVGYDLLDPKGRVLSRQSTWIAPYGHAQWALSGTVTGGTVVVYLRFAPQDALLFPYASVVHQRTGDPVYVEAHMTAVGWSLQAVAARTGAGIQLPPRQPAPSFQMSR
ncbi:MAG: hypothetical protein NZ869_09950 [Thermoanaerobaculum sp.]|nr:hypothetical protein [Thermoanaerobaculum sp.]MDW7967175.1 hypothetical protein [Thermoanaerobaculum sp.]